MGSELSALHHANGSSSSSMTNYKVVAFHSIAQWKAHFKSSKDTAKLMVIDFMFMASWCAPYRFMKPAINEFMAKYTEVEFIKIEVDGLMDVAQEFGVQEMPTFVLIKRGKIVDKVTAAKKEKLQNKIETHRAYDYYS